MVKVIHIFITLSFEKDILYGSSAKIHVFPNTKIKQETAPPLATGSKARSAAERLGLKIPNYKKGSP